MNTKHWIGASAAALLLAGLGSAQTFSDISPFSAVDISSDGTTLVGFDPIMSLEGIYNIQTGLILNTPLDGSVAVADGGILIAGRFNPPSPALDEAAYYDALTGQTNLGGLSAGCSGTLTTAYDISAEGNSVVGLVWINGCQMANAFIWDATVGGPVTPLSSQGANGSRANAVSGDGLTVGGWDRVASTQNQAAIWKFDPMTGSFATDTLPLVGVSAANPDGLGEVTAINADGSAAVIMSGLNSDPTARLWFEDGTLIDLGDVPGAPGQRTVPTGLTDDAKMVVGNTAFSPILPPPVAFVWTASGGMQTADDFFTNAGVALPMGFAASTITGCSADGKVIAGSSGSFPFFTNWVIELPSFTKYGVGVSPTNSLDLDGSGSTSVPAGVLTLTTTGIDAAAAVALGVVSLAPANAPVFGGIILVDPAIPSLQLPILVAPNVGGTASMLLVMPTDPSAAGLSFYVQTAAADAAMPAGIALSNGLRGVVCD